MRTCKRIAKILQIERKFCVISVIRLIWRKNFLSKMKVTDKIKLKNSYHTLTFKNQQKTKWKRSQPDYVRTYGLAKQRPSFTLIFLKVLRRLNTVWKLLKFTLVIFSQKCYDINATKYVVLCNKCNFHEKFFVRVNFSFLHTVAKHMNYYTL